MNGQAGKRYCGHRDIVGKVRIGGENRITPVLNAVNLVIYAFVEETTSSAFDALWRSEIYLVFASTKSDRALL
jgi:hypothetical protein